MAWDRRCLPMALLAGILGRKGAVYLRLSISGKALVLSQFPIEESHTCPSGKVLLFRIGNKTNTLIYSIW